MNRHDPPPHWRALLDVLEAFYHPDADVLTGTDPVADLRHLVHTQRITGAQPSRLPIADFLTQLQTALEMGEDLPGDLAAAIGHATHYDDGSAAAFLRRVHADLHPDAPPTAAGDPA